MSAKSESLQIIDLINERESHNIGTATLTGETYFDGTNTWHQVQATKLDTAWLVALAPSNPSSEPPYEVAESIEEINARIL